MAMLCGSAFAANEAKPLVQGYAAQRVVEKMDRGVIAIPAAEGKVHVGWRLLSGDPKDVGFNVYRRLLGESRVTRLTREPISKTTDFIDEKTPRAKCEYLVAAVVDGQERPLSPASSVDPSAAFTSYLSIKLNGNHMFQKLAIADLDGDGRYDYVIKNPNSNVDPYSKYWRKSSGTYHLEAYNADGKFLWRYDLGWAIEQGIWYSPFVVYDLDGDGKAEVALKTGEGDPRDSDGRVRSGPEYVSVLDGMSGTEKAKILWPDREGFRDYNYYCRNQMAVAYLDGKTPALLVQRGTYTFIKLYAYEFHDGKLRELWHWVSNDEKPNWNGQGAHCLRAADIDGDGRDEVALGSGVIDDNGTGLWCTGLGHPDHVYIGDLDPLRPGTEIYYGLERAQKAGNGMCMVDAATGRILWGIKRPTRHVHGQGLVADLDPRYPGCETYSADTDPKKKFAWSLLHDCKGNVISEENLGGFAPRAAYWDASTQRTIINGKGALTELDGPKRPLNVPLKTEGTVVGVADILGDWREEIITTLPGEMRIYTTTIPARDRRLCLMQDPFYRADISTASQGYYQIPTPKVLPGFEK
ncbi:MAG TPA: silent information regulator protein Sir2 [Planctomycetaceae bacterium]|nr:silent information regulator protein Sir2 [Planctomycetaceae bacterium]